MATIIAKCGGSRNRGKRPLLLKLQKAYDVPRMNPHPAPTVPGDMPGQKLSNAIRMVLTVSKDDLLRKEARLKRASAKRRAKKI
jgi:hypothetical protein